MARRRNKIEVLEDSFSDLTLDDKRRLMPVLQGLLRQHERNGAALTEKPRPAQLLGLLDEHAGTSSAGKVE